MFSVNRIWNWKLVWDDVIQIWKVNSLESINSFNNSIFVKKFFLFFVFLLSSKFKFNLNTLRKKFFKEKIFCVLRISYYFYIFFFKTYNSVCIWQSNLVTLFSPLFLFKQSFEIWNTYIILMAIHILNIFFITKREQRGANKKNHHL